MRIIIDGFGGDNAPLEVLKGAARAKKELGVDITVTGDKDKIDACAKENGIDLSGIEIYHAPDVIDVCCDPAKILKEHKDCSMAAGLKLLRDGAGDAFVCAGSTGALVFGATFIVKRLKGIKRAALATVFPTAKTPCMILDVGANADCRPEMIAQFGVMGSAYMSKHMKIENPRVGLANIGSEPTKGREQELESYDRLSRAPINFIGNVEGRDIPLGGADVVVADGFTGNMILKTMEGMGKFFSMALKDMFKSGVSSSVGALLMKNSLMAFKKKMDYTEYGGAPLLGTAKPVIKAHGASNENAFFNAIRQAKIFVETKVIDEISSALAEIKAGESEEDGQAK